MQLYLLRHADADTIAASDEARALSDKGEAQAKKVARFCEAHDVSVSPMLTSPVRRALQTAEIVANHLRAELIAAPWLACGMRPLLAVDELKKFRTKKSVMIVGHEPDFSLLIAHLIGLPFGSQIQIRKASLTLIEIETLEKGGGRLEFCIPCKLM
jgi:phosphohistidine phosphatase